MKNLKKILFLFVLSSVACASEGQKDKFVLDGRGEYITPSLARLRKDLLPLFTRKEDRVDVIQDQAVIEFDQRSVASDRTYQSSVDTNSATTDHGDFVSYYKALVAEEVRRHEKHNDYMIARSMGLRK
jgi:hypothetical protein